MIVSTVFENEPSSAQEVEILFHTLDRLGGELAAARRIACTVGEVDPFYVEVLEDLGVELVVLAPDPDPATAPIDVLRTVDVVDDACDVLLALRSDVAFAGDPTGWLSTNAVTARCAPDGSLQTAVLGMPARHAVSLRRRWLELVPELRAWNQAGSVEQLALAMAVAHLDLPFAALPGEVAFPVQGPASQIQCAYDVAPFILVHEHMLQRTGELRRSGLAVPDFIIERVNAELRPEVTDGASPPGEAVLPRTAGEQPYFPNRSVSLLTVESQYRAHVSQLDEAARYRAYTAFTHQHPRFVTSTFHADGSQVVVRQADRDIAFPRPLPLIKYAHISCGYEEWLEHKYSLPGFVTVERDDIVVDCGAFVGGFSIGAARTAGAVHVFEPEPANVACIERNFDGVDTVVVNPCGLFTRTGTEWLNVSESGVEHSMLQPDDGDAVGRISIQVTRLDDYCSTRSLDRLDFVKVEAEGVELEVLLGLGEMRPVKIAVDVSAERDGTSPATQITSLLAGWGYETRQRGNVLFARHASRYPGKRD